MPGTYEAEAERSSAGSSDTAPAATPSHELSLGGRTTAQSPAAKTAPALPTFSSGPNSELANPERRSQAELPSTFAQNNERRPIRGVRFMRFALIDQGQHGLAKCLGATDGLLARDFVDCGGDELHRGIGIDRPV